MDISQFDKYGTGPLREKALADYLESLDGEDDGTPGAAPTFQQVLTAGKTLTETNLIDVNGKSLTFDDAEYMRFTTSEVTVDIYGNSFQIGVGTGTQNRKIVFTKTDITFVSTDAGVGNGFANTDGKVMSTDANGHLTLVDAGAGGGLALESYQNSAMTTPVQAYVFRDADDNIVRVYEPLRNNDVRIKTYPDKFRFDNVTWINNTINNVNFKNIGEDAVIEFSTLDTLVIEGKGNPLSPVNVYNLQILSWDTAAKTITLSVIEQGDFSERVLIGATFTITGDQDRTFTVVSKSFSEGSVIIEVAEVLTDLIGEGTYTAMLGDTQIPAAPFTGLVVTNWIHKGDNGEAIHGADIHVAGNNVELEESWVGCGTFFDGLGENAKIEKTFFDNYSDIYFNGYKDCEIKFSQFNVNTYCRMYANSSVVDKCFAADSAGYLLHGGTTRYCTLLANSIANVYFNLTAVTIGVNSTVISENTALGYCSIGADIQYTPTNNIEDINMTRVAEYGSDPTTVDLPNRTIAAFKNTSTGDVKLWLNDGGTMKSIAFT